MKEIHIWLCQKRKNDKIACPETPYLSPNDITGSSWNRVGEFRVENPRNLGIAGRLWDTYCFSGFRPEPTLRGIFGDPKARVITLNRRSKKQPAGAVVASRWAGTSA